MSGPGAPDPYAPGAEFYDLVGPARYRNDIGFFVETAREAGGPVLEIGCGTGRVLIPTARAGIPITGIDASHAMLDQCRRHLADEPDQVRSRVSLFEADMRSFTLADRYRLITLPFRPFQHITTVEGQTACLAAIHNHLSDGGRLVLDLFNPWLELIVDPDAQRERDVGPPAVMPDGRRVLVKSRIVSQDRINQTTQFEITYDVTHPGGREERLVHADTIRYFFRFEVEHLLARCGFRVEHVYADYERHPLGSSYPGELIFVATRVGS